MGTNRKLKTDGNLEIESNQVDINSDIDVSGDVGATTVTTTSDATVGGNASVTGNVSCVDVDATGDLGGATATVTGNVSCVDVDATGDLGGATVTTTGNATIGGDVDATGDLGGATSTITGDASVGGDLTVTGDTSTTDLTASGTGSFTGNLSVSSINNLTFPSSDGTNGQAIITDGSGALSFGDVSSGGGGGGADIDIIASASDATNYTGTAKFIHITSTAAVTFTNATIENRIIYNLSNSNVTFECDNFLSNIYKSDGSGSLYIKSKGDGSDPGATYNNTNVKGCDISNNNWVFLFAGSHDPSGSLEEDLLFLVNSCRINGSLSFQYNSAGYGKHYVGSSNLTGWNIYNQETRDDSLNIRYGTRIEAGNFYGYANILTDATINAGSSNSNTVKIENGTDTFVNGVYNFPFTVNKNGVDTKVIVKATRATTDQSIVSTGDTKLEWNSEEIDNTSVFDTATNYRMTAKVKGYYRITCNAYLFSVSATQTGFLFIYKNGSFNENFLSAPIGDASLGRVTIVNDIIELDVNDYIEIYAKSADGNYTFKNDFSYLTFEKIN